MGLKIIGTGKALPRKAVSNNEIADILETSDEWITTRTGIRNRYVCTDEGLTDIAESSARVALRKAGVEAGDIDLIICPTLAGDFVFPSLACCLAERLGVKCPAFDVNAACSGFVYGLEIADALITAGRYGCILIVSADMMSRLVDWGDRATCVLFGDGAGACVVTQGDAIKYIKTDSYPNSEMLFAKNRNGNNPFTKSERGNGYVQMKGQEVYEFAVKAVASEISEALEKTGLSAEDVDHFVLHQANGRIVDSVRKRLKQPIEKFPVNIHNYANTTAATIPILLDEMVNEGKVKKGDVLVMVGFGAGMTTGTCVMVWE